MIMSKKSEQRDKVTEGSVRISSRIKKAIEDEEYVKWMFMLGEYHRGQRD